MKRNVFVVVKDNTTIMGDLAFLKYSSAEKFMLGVKQHFRNQFEIKELTIVED